MTMKKDYTQNAYRTVVALAFMMHAVFSALFFYFGMYPVAIYNVFLTSLYALFYVLISRRYFRLTLVLIHMEVCIFVSVMTLTLGWSWGFWIYLVALSSFIYFNPFVEKRRIYIFTAVEMVLFFVLRTCTLEKNLAPNRDTFFFYINFLGCFIMIFVGTFASKVAFNTLTQQHRLIAYDTLTGALRREYFMLRAEEKLQEQTPFSKCYLVLTNIVEFRYYNEIFGDKKGDEVLITQVNLLKQKVSTMVGIGRVSGDEFALLVDAEQFDDKKLSAAIEEIQNRFFNTIIPMRIHVGVYEIRDAHESVSAMIDKAKIAIDSLKNVYTDFLVYYNRSMLEESLKEKRVLGEFEYALQNGQFGFYLQPQVLADGTCFGAEALARWNHPENGLIAPINFIPILERSGLIWKLDQYIWEQVAKKLREWQELGRNDMSISINLSPCDFKYLDIYQTMVSLVEKYQIQPDKLKLEITETALMIDIQKQIDLIQRLRKYGFEIDLDDFGSGYSSLNTLKDIQVDVLKIDMKFIQETEHRQKSWSILDTIISLAKKIGMLTLTEGVETNEQLSMLAEEGCDMFQGFYFSKPIPVSEFEQKYMGTKEI